MLFIIFSPKRDSFLKLEYIITSRLERNKPQASTRFRTDNNKGPFQASLKSKCGNPRGLCYWARHGCHQQREQ